MKTIFTGTSDDRPLFCSGGLEVAFLGLSTRIHLSVVAFCQCYTTPREQLMPSTHHATTRSQSHSVERGRVLAQDRGGVDLTITPSYSQLGALLWRTAGRILRPETERGIPADLTNVIKCDSPQCLLDRGCCRLSRPQTKPRTVSVS